jgi:hypothetical protein
VALNQVVLISAAQTLSLKERLPLSEQRLSLRVKPEPERIL